MNKYIIIGVLLVLVVVGGALVGKGGDSTGCSPEVGRDLNYTITSKKLEWSFEPDQITVEQCDRVNLTVVNEDNFDHGFAIDAFGISQRLPANGTIKVNFIATHPGTFKFYCSVSCSDSKSENLPGGNVQTGKHAGTFRGHFEHLGDLIINALRGVTN